MFETHTTKSGSTILICQMSDTRLLNTIRLYLSQIKNGRELIESSNFQGLSIMGAIRPELDIDKIKAKAKDSLKFLHNKVQPYIMEACLRGLAAEFTEDLQSAYGRSSQLDLTALAGKLTLPGANDIIDGDGDDTDVDDDDDDNKGYSRIAYHKFS